MCLIVCLLTSTQQAYGQRIYLLSIGVSDYPGDNRDLMLSAADAKRIKWLYGKNKKAESILLTDSLATKARVIEAMHKLYQQANEDDIIVFFFSGHGYSGAFSVYDRSLEYTDIRNAMAKSKSKHKMIFADACHAGYMRQEANSSRRGKKTDIDVMMFLSSRDNEYSMESSSMTNGYFTSALEQGLRGKADSDHNRIVTARELFLFVNKKVKELSKDNQHPVMWGRFDNDMPVMVW